MVYGLMKIARVDNPSSGEIPAYGGRLGAYKGGGTMKTFSTKFSEIVQLCISYHRREIFSFTSLRRGLRLEIVCGTERNCALS